MPTTIEMFKNLNAFKRISTNKSALIVNMQQHLQQCQQMHSSLKLQPCRVQFGLAANGIGSVTSRLNQLTWPKSVLAGLPPFMAAVIGSHKRFVVAK